MLNNNFHEFLKSFYVKFLVVVLVVVVDGDVCSFFVLNDLQEFFTVSRKVVEFTLGLSTIFKIFSLLETHNWSLRKDIVKVFL